MKNFIIALLIIMLVSFAIGGTIVGLTYSGISTDDNVYTQYVMDSQVFPMEGAPSINVKTISSDVTFIPVDSENVEVNFHGELNSNVDREPPKLIVEHKFGGYSIEIKYPKNFGGYTNSNVTLDIYIPKNYTGKLELNGVSSDIDLHDINLESLKINSISGEVDLENVNSPVEIVEVSGDVELNNHIGEIQIHSVSGDSDINGNLNDDITVGTVSGDVDLQLNSDAAFNFDFETTSGKFDCKFPVNIDSSKGKSISGTVNGGGYMIDVQTVSGDLNIA